MYTFAIDPGKHKSGWAVFNDERAFYGDAGHDDNAIVRNLIGMHIASGKRLVIEMPQTYDGRAAKGDANDLLAVAFEVGRFVEVASCACDKTLIVKPSEWKGQMKKAVSHARAKETLTAAELAKVPFMARSRAHNMWDAIAICLWAVERRAIPR
jgi:hypothetical protein